MQTIDLDSEATAATMHVSPTAKRMSEARAAASRANGAIGGHPKGKGQADKRTYDPDTLASNLAERIITGHGLPMNPFSRATAPTEEDNRHVARITGIPVEEFQAKISARLQEIAEKAGIRIVEKLDEGGQKLSDLNMTLAISIDKLAAISGRTAQSGNVSVTVNNYGAMTREQMLASVEKERKAGAIEV
jgi:hypothetical protein